MTPIQTNKPLFFDDDGDALEGGQIYVGQPATDPRTNPKTVTFRDSGGATFTASQPMKTVAGRIVYNGKPIVALVDGEHSLMILDSSGKQLDYSRSVEPTNSGEGSITDFSQLARVGLTLADIKAFDVSVGDSVRNVGKITATDNLGADWLAVSATGTPADDVDLIDFTNGLQGQRVKNSLYRKEFDPKSPKVVWTGSEQKVLYSDLSETGTGFYVVDSGRRYLLYFIEGSPLSDTSPTSVSTSYAATFAGDRSSTYFVRMGWSAGDSDVTITSPSVLSDGTDGTDSFITAIYKV